MLDGPSFGEPLEATGLGVFVATENGNVPDALAANSGEVLWSDHVGTPMPYSYYGCGDVKPEVGITGTPVIDTARSEIFAVANEDVDGAPAHFLVGLNIYTGAQELNVAVDPPGDAPGPICSNGPGSTSTTGTSCSVTGATRVAAIRTTAGSPSCPRLGTPNFYDTTGDAAGSARGWWGPRARSGWVAPRPRSTPTATSGWARATAHPTRPTTAATRCSSSPPPSNSSSSSRPSDWSYQNANDQDMGSEAPALLSNGTLLQVGKSFTAYL